MSGKWKMKKRLSEIIDVERLGLCAPECIKVNNYHKENWRGLIKQYYNMKGVPSDSVVKQFFYQVRKMNQINLEKSVKQKSNPTHDPPEEWKVTESFDNNIGNKKNTPKIAMSQGSDSDNDYHQEINERTDDFNWCNKETPVKVYSEVELAQKIVSDTKTPTKEDSLASFAGEVFYHFAQRAIQTQGLNNHKVKLDNPQNGHTHVNNVYDIVHTNMSEDSRIMNLLSRTKEFSDTDYIRANLLKISAEIPSQTDFDNLEIVKSKTGDKSFGHNYTNYSAEILKKLNP